MESSNSEEKSGHVPDPVPEVKHNEIASSFVLRQQANAVIKRYVAWSAGAGLIPVPLLDFAALSGVQLKMIKELCVVYGVPFERSVARSVVISLIGSLGAGALAPVLTATAFKLLPGIATVFTGASLSATSAGVTYGIGHVFMEHFGNGGTLKSFNIVEGKFGFKRKLDEGTQV